MRFCDVLEIRNGKNQRKVENPNGKYPIYGSGGIMGWADDYICPQNTVIIGRKGSINNPIYVDTPFWNVDTAFGLVANSEILLPKYLYYFCCAFNFDVLSTTVTIPSLTKANLLQIEIDLPSLEKQQEIVGILDCIADAENVLNDQISCLDDLVKSRFIEMFGDPNDETLSGERKSIEDVCDNIYGGGTPSKAHKEYYIGDIPWVTPKDMKSMSIDDSQDHITSEAIENSTTKLIPKDSVLMVIRSGILKHTLPVAINNVEVTINQDMKAFVPSSILTPEYLLYTFKMMEESILSKVRGVTADNIEFSEFKKRQIFIPTIELQKQFADFVTITDKSKLAVQQSLETLQTLKAKLMQDYFG